MKTSRKRESGRPRSPSSTIKRATSLYKGYHAYLAKHVITPFYERRLEKLQKLNLNYVLKRKNPYLFKAKNILLAQDLVKGIVDAFLSSQEEGIFGNLLEGFAIYVSSKLHGGFKSQFKSVDLEFERGHKYYIVGIKSGPYWGNSDQINAMKTNFVKAKKALCERGIAKRIVAVNGCIYGKDRKPYKRDAERERSYLKYCGETFWKFISGDDNLYREIIAPIDQEAKKKDDVFKDAYAAKINEMTQDFSSKFIAENQIDWLELIDYVSKKQPPRQRTARKRKRSSNS